MENFTNFMESENLEGIYDVNKIDDKIVELDNIENEIQNFRYASSIMYSNTNFQSEYYNITDLDMCDVDFSQNPIKGTEVVSFFVDKNNAKKNKRKIQKRFEENNKGKIKLKASIASVSLQLQRGHKLLKFYTQKREKKATAKLNIMTNKSKKKVTLFYIFKIHKLSCIHNTGNNKINRNKVC